MDHINHIDISPLNHGEIAAIGTTFAGRGEGARRLGGGEVAPDAAHGRESARRCRAEPTTWALW